MARPRDKVARYAEMLAALGTEPRLRIVRLLLSYHPSGIVVGDIQKRLGMAASTLSHHLDKLKQQRLVRVRRERQFLWYSADADALQGLLAFLFEECCSRSGAVAADAVVGTTEKRASPTEPPAEESELMSERQVKEVVRERYGEAALKVLDGGSCCGTQVQPTACDPITSNLYSTQETGDLPVEAVTASLGCGNPTALAELKPGEVVLDLGSGGGIDVLLSARRVGPEGKAYGLDMTDEMLALARQNQRKAGLDNVEFLKGEIENIPLPDNSVDVIVSNCVINLSGDKDRVLREAFRVLRPGGRFAVSDVVVRGEVPPEIRRNVELWIGCVAGALEEDEYRTKLAAAGFSAISVEPTRIYSAEDARPYLESAGLDFETHAASMEGKFMSAFVRARK